LLLIINIYNKQIAQPNKGKKLKNYLRNNRNFLLFLLLFGIFRTAVADWNPIPSGSMRPNLLEGDVVFVNRVAFDLKVPLTDRIVAHIGEPQRGDIVTFSSPKDGTRLIKRIAAVPGDMIAMRGKKLIVNGREASYEPTATVTEDVNGTPLQALRMTERSGAQTHTIQWLPQIAARDNFGPVQIPPDQFLMLGDNRDDSADSRYIGLVPRKMLIGRAVRILVSADIKGNWAPRFDRFGQKLE
jgi:signal peptidase I